MVDAMTERMREQNARPREEMGGNDDGKKAVPRPSAIKVTTVKMMAQLLQESQIIGASATCDMLLSLLAEARHIDTLVAIVSSLLSTLKGSTYLPEIHTRVLDALEASLSPVLPRLSQRRALSEADWAAVESGEAELPSVADEKPLISLLLRCQDYDSEVMSREARARLLELLVRVPAQSALHNARWNKLFLARNGFSLDKGERLPTAPACLEVSVDLLSRFPAHVPASTLTVLCDMALVNLDPTPGIARVTEAVKADRDLVNSNAGRHWLAQFDNPGVKALERFGLLVAALLLQRPAAAAGGLLASKHADDGRGVTVQMVAESVLAVADRIIACQLPETFEKLVARLCSERSGSRAHWLAWREHCVPVLTTMAAKVDGLHSLRRLPGGDEPVPRVLPSLFQLRVSMLPIPYSKPPKEPAQGEEVDAFVLELAGLVEWLVRRGLPYHNEFAQLKKEVRQGLNRADNARVALRLGGLGNSTAVVEGGGFQAPTLAGYLLLELAGHLLVEAGESMIKGCGDLPEVQQMVDKWVGSDDEFVRQMGIAVEKKYKVLFS
jgi:hypothetical protein